LLSHDLLEVHSLFWLCCLLLLFINLAQVVEHLFSGASAFLNKAFFRLFLLSDILSFLVSLFIPLILGILLLLLLLLLQLALLVFGKFAGVDVGELGLLKFHGLELGHASRAGSLTKFKVGSRLFVRLLFFFWRVPAHWLLFHHWLSCFHRLCLLCLHLLGFLFFHFFLFRCFNGLLLNRLLLFDLLNLSRLLNLFHFLRLLRGGSGGNGGSSGSFRMQVGSLLEGVLLMGCSHKSRLGVVVVGLYFLWLVSHCFKVINIGFTLGMVLGLMMLGRMKVGRMRLLCDIGSLTRSLVEREVVLLSSSHGGASVLIFINLFASLEVIFRVFVLLVRVVGRLAVVLVHGGTLRQKEWVCLKRNRLNSINREQVLQGLLILHLGAHLIRHFFL